jgi:hypothetical protein
LQDGPGEGQFQVSRGPQAGVQVLDVPALEVILEVLDHRLVELELERQLLFQDDDLVLQALAGAVAEVLQFLGAGFQIQFGDIAQVPLSGPVIEIELDAPWNGLVFHAGRCRHG